MRAVPLALHVLFLWLVSASIVQANNLPTTIPLPLPQLKETTLLHVARTVHGGPLSQSLTCDVATTRALAQLTTRIQQEQTAQRISTNELALIRPPRISHRWDADRHACHVHVRLEIPVIPHRSHTHAPPDLAGRFHHRVN